MLPDSLNTGQSSAGFHRLQTFMCCPQEFAYNELMRLIPQYEGKARCRGTVLHTGLTAYYSGENGRKAIQNVERRFTSGIDESLKLYDNYVHRYLHETFLVLDVEKEITVELKGKKFTRRVDLIVENNGRVFVIDHKTAWKPAERQRTASDDWSLATQEVVGKAVLPSEYGLPWGGVTLNLIGTSGAPEFRRATIRFPRNVLERIPRSLLYYYEEIERLANEGTGEWKYPRSGNCWRQYGHCDYLSLCRDGEYGLQNFSVKPRQ